MKELQIGGLVSFTTIDYPGKLAAVLFLVGCPLKCAYCSNAHLIPVGEGEYDPEKTFEWLKSRVGKLEGVVFSGGEALMQADVTIEYMKRVKDLGFSIGLHTNGFYPDLLKKCVDIVDWIGLDFKATKQHYKDLTGIDIAYDRMIESLQYWVSTGHDLEVRTTCDPRYVSKDDLLEIAEISSKMGVKNFAVQKYNPYNECDCHQTNAEQREQFFNDDELKQKIESLFESVVWRNN
ncbi:MAG: anaerobic ribonucleoside-triphosphate reductase activating protein [Alphaproteobacteria bacterium]|nr:anaerobic ribonucleoside-triphosphate reductase activating protein [Alphaproteobacteria bacterium]